MPVIDRLLKRWGFAKLSRYGLVMTHDDRILSTRPAVLDDGAGGRIVGWQDGDLAVMELPSWETEAVHRAAMAPFAAAPAAPAAPSAPPAIGSRPPATTATPVAAAKAAPAARPVAAGPVAAKPQVEEDDWEWEIALARARVATDVVEEAAHALMARAPAARPAASASRPVAAAPVAAAPPVTARPPARPAPRPTPPPPPSPQAPPTSVPITRPTFAASEIAAMAPVAPTPPPAAPRTASFATPTPPPEKPAFTPPPGTPPHARPAFTPGELASRLRPVVGAKSGADERVPVSRASIKTAPIATVAIPPAGDARSHDPTEVGVEIARKRAVMAPRTATRPVPVVTVPPKAQPDTARRFAKGTAPSGETYVGPGPVAPPSDEHTATDILLSDQTATDIAIDATTPNLSIGDRTKPGFALPSARSRATR